MFQGLKTIWVAVSQDPNIVLALIIAVVILLYSHIHIWLSCRGRLKDKDKHIDDLIVERNRLHDFLFEQQGRSRLSGKKENS